MVKKINMNAQIQNRSTLVVLVLVLLSWMQVESIRFDLESGKIKCINEDITIKTTTVGNYKIVNPNEGHPLPDSHKLTVRVTSAYGNSYHYSDHVSEGHFAFQAVEEGDYMACFFADDHSPAINMTIDFEWKSGFMAKDLPNLPKKTSVESMEKELERMLDTVKSISHEMYVLRSREMEMHMMNKDTSSKMFWLSFVYIGISLSVTGFQFWHLKSFFEKKKLI